MGIDLITYLKINQFTFNNFKSSYYSGLIEFLKEFEDNTELYYIKESEAFNNKLIFEISDFLKNIKENNEDKEDLLQLCRNRLNTIGRTKEFLEQRKQELETESKENKTIKNVQDIDLSNSNAVEKIIYLNELGIIDFLRTKTKAGISNTALASVLSGITGIKTETIKPSLNRLSNNDTIDNKHPYYTTKTVEKIKTFIIKLGF